MIKKKVITEVNPSTVLLNGANKLVSEVFGLGDDYTLVKFDNKGNKAIVTFESNGFDVAVTIKGNMYFKLIKDLGLLDDEPIADAEEIEE